MNLRSLPPTFVGSSLLGSCGSGTRVILRLGAKDSEEQWKTATPAGGLLTGFGSTPAGVPLFSVPDTSSDDPPIRFHARPCFRPHDRITTGVAVEAAPACTRIGIRGSNDASKSGSASPDDQTP